MNDQIEQLKTVLTASPPRESFPMDERRKMFDAADGILGSTAPAPAEERDIDAGGVRAVLRIPEHAGPDGLIIYIHGGGFVEGSPISHRGLTLRLASYARIPLLALDYRLAPEHPFSAALDDCVQAIEWALSETNELPNSGGRSVLAGDSAGGNLTISSLLKLRDDGSAAFGKIAGGVAMSGWFSLKNQGASYDQFDGTDPVLTKGHLDEYRDLYLAGSEVSPGDSPYVDGVTADLAGLPPLRIDFGGAEILRDDSRNLANSAEGSGVKVVAKEWPDMIHAFQLFAQYVEMADQALREDADWIRSALGLGSD